MGISQRQILYRSISADYDVVIMDILNKLNTKQQEAVTHTKGPLLIVAGAGTGKTTVVTYRIAWLIEQKLAKPDEILALTFTDKAAAEMVERLDVLLPLGYFDLWVSTFHSFCERVLKQNALDIGLPDNFKLLNQTQQWLLVRQNLNKFDLKYYQPLGNPTKFIHALLKHFSRCKDEEITADDYLKYIESIKSTKSIKSIKSIKHALSEVEGSKVHKVEEVNSELEIDDIDRLEEIAKAYKVYQQLLLDNDCLDFGDLINYALKLFRERPAILKKYQEQFKYILVDEFQDTNWAQYELVKLLLNKEQNLTVVGDDKQSIYKFRGASLSNILSFLKDFPKAQEIVLTENYRSAQEILDLSFNFIKLNESNGPYEQIKIPHQRLISAVDFHAQIEHWVVADWQAEAWEVAEKIQALKKQDPEITWSDFAILVRANSAAAPFMDALAVAGIPAVFYSLKGLYNKPIILDVIALFKLLDNYHESSALYRILNMPLWPIVQTDFAKLTYESKKRTESLFETLRKADTIFGLNDQTRLNIKKILALIDKYSAIAKTKSIAELYSELLQDSGYLKYLVDQNNQASAEQLGYLQQFYERLKNFSNQMPEPTLNSFMTELKLELEAGEEGSIQFDPQVGPEMVRVMTIHGAKGLEFKYVFIVGLVDKRFPTIERSEAITIPEKLIKETLPVGDIHLEEERRLFYVAMTRAKQGLFLTAAQDYGGARTKKVSRFIEELKLKPEQLKVITKPNLSSEQLFYSLPKQRQIAKPNVILPMPKHFSYSQLAAFATCPLQYKFNFILKIPIHGKGVFSFGKTMHSTLQKFFQLVKSTSTESPPLAEDFSGAESTTPNPSLKRRGEIASPPSQGGVRGGASSTQQSLFTAKSLGPSLDDLLKIYEENWIGDWYDSAENRQKYYEKGIAILKEFYKKHQNNWPKVHDLEKGFNLKIGDYVIRGVIDRIDDVTSGVEIVDYKTGEAKTEEKLDSESKAQLLLYQLAVEEVWQLKPVRLTFYYLNNNQPVSFLGSADELISLKEKILNQIEQIKQSNFAPTPSWKCQFCDFFDICDYRQSV